MSSLHVTTYGSGPLVVACHGFTQTGESWRTLATHLQDSHTIVALDLPGHGGSAHVQANLEETAAMIASIAAGEQFSLLGYSLGARVALTATLAKIEGLNRSILISGTAGIEDDQERVQRRMLDEALADEIEDEDDVAAFIERWLAQPLFASLPRALAGSDERLVNTPAGLASSLRLSGTGTQKPSWDRLDSIDVPVDLIVGAQDQRYVEINTAMVERLRHGRLHVVDDAGHAVHLEQANRVATLLGDILASE